MSEDGLPIRSADVAQETQEALGASKSAGQLLREAREAQGLHVAALAVSLKVPIKKIEALEADRLEDLPDAVFVRALASSVCRALKIDPAPVLEQLPQLNKRVLDQSDAGMNVAFKNRSDMNGVPLLAGLNSKVILGVIALLLAAIIVIMVPDFREKSASSPATSSQTVSTITAPAVAMGQMQNVPSVHSNTSQSGVTSPISASALASAASGTAPRGVSSALAPISVTPANSTPSVASPTLALSALAKTTPALAVPTDAVVVFAVTGESWIEVRDAGGQIILQRTLQNGEKAGVGPASGKLPFSVIVGRGHLTQVSVRGKPFNLTQVLSTEGVARFQVQ